MTELQKCKDENLTEKFYSLHEEIVDKVIAFCKENKISCDVFSLRIDGMLDSIDFGKWGAATDSSCTLKEKHNDTEPFLYSI